MINPGQKSLIASRLFCAAYYPTPPLQTPGLACDGLPGGGGGDGRQVTLSRGGGGGVGRVFQGKL